MCVSSSETLLLRILIQNNYEENAFTGNLKEPFSLFIFFIYKKSIRKYSFNFNYAKE